MKREGYEVVCGETIWTQNKAKSAPAQVRAAELNQMMQDDQIGIVIPPWGGELLVEILEYIILNILKHDDFSGPRCAFLA